MSVYQSEQDKWVEMDVIGTVIYRGPTFGAVSLTNNRKYAVVRLEQGFLGIVDDSDEDYLYSATDPGPCFDTSISGKWEIAEDPTGQIESLVNGNPRPIFMG